MLSAPGALRLGQGALRVDLAVKTLQGGSATGRGGGATVFGFRPPFMGGEPSDEDAFGGVVCGEKPDDEEKAEHAGPNPQRPEVSIARPKPHSTALGCIFGGVIAPRIVHVPYVVERDEDGVWCAHAQLRPGVGAHGQGEDEAAAVADLREALTGLIGEFGVPRELAVTVAAA